MLCDDYDLPGPGLWKKKKPSNGAAHRWKAGFPGTRLAASGQDLLLFAGELFGGDHSPVAQVSQLR